MKMNKLKLNLMVIFFVAAGELFAGGGNRNGTAGATELLIPVGTRGIAMGQSILTNSQGLDAIFYNPANLARAEYNTNVFLSNMNYIADISVQYGAISTQINGFGSLAFDIKVLNIGEIEITTAESPDGTGSNFTPQVITLGLTYARELSDRITVGLTGNYISEQIALVGATGVAFNIGLSYADLANISGLHFGLAIKNLGPPMKYDGSGLNIQAESPDLERPQQYYRVEAQDFELPASLEIGLGYQLNINEQNALIVTSMFQSNNFWGDEYRVGAEYGFSDLFFIRGGYSLAPEIDDAKNTYGLTLGAGVDYEYGGINLKVEYAFRDVDYFDANHVFSLGLGF